MTIYYVMAESYHDHGPLAVFESEAEAKDRAWSYATDPRPCFSRSTPSSQPNPYNGDGRHNYAVYRAETDGSLPVLCGTYIAKGMLREGLVPYHWKPA